ncbi:ribonuclease R [Aureimonas endophytica]|uniref:Ribonuclease R n=1 Tax=Aureimonas endophytica TaxID=2027858 RepID=A0A916ZCU5_9HYPH|nr:ribonuclease R [Aureimonas endophytica]GGD88284.1 ribonuclease R [Aureimonas endophytica]
MAKRGGHRTTGPELTREAVLRFIAENPDRATKREIARAFEVKGESRNELKDIIADLQAEGALAGNRRSYSRPGALPDVTVLEIRRRDDDGGLLAEPPGWEEDSQGPRPVFVVRQNERTATAGVGDRILAKLDQEAPEGPTASVIRVLEKKQTLALGVFRAAPGGGGRIEPVERRALEYAIGPADTGGARSGDLVEVEPLDRGRAGLPRGRVVTVIGSLGSERAISTIALHAHSIPHIFPRGVLTEAEAAGDRAFGPEHEDWRALPLVTIDPADAKDHDDAVHAARDHDPSNPGGMVLTVAIADVSWYVRPGSRLDEEARLRGNSVYFPDRVVPMLPERISNDLCSLRPEVDRPALAVRMVISAEGRKVKHSFHRVLMRSHARLAYQDAQAAIDGRESPVSPAIVNTVLRPLWTAYGLLRQARTERQPLDLDLPEKKIVLDEHGRVERVVVPDRLDAHRLIEEFMILANVAAAEALEARRQALIYRVHDAPSLAKLEALRDFLRTLDISLARSGSLRPAHFNGILAEVRAGEHEHLVNEIVLRTQSQAIYSPENLGHFGLNLMRYAHFTSPIRRYADLVVHRALVAALGLGEGGLTKEEEARLTETADEISKAERRAMAAERETVDRLIAHHLAERVGDQFDGRITGVTKSGLFVSLPGFGADGFIPISTLGHEYFDFDEAAHSLVGSRSGTGFRLGDAVEVKLVEAIPLAGSMQFQMLSEPRPLGRSTSSFHKTKLRPSGRPRGKPPKNVAGRVRKKR